MVRGPGALAFLERVTSNHVEALFPGRVQYSCMPNGKGGLVDDLLVYNLAPESYMLVVNAGNLRKDWEWLKQHLPQDGSVSIEDRSESTALWRSKAPMPCTSCNRSAIRICPVWRITISPMRRSPA